MMMLWMGLVVCKCVGEVAGSVWIYDMLRTKMEAGDIWNIR